MGNGTTRIQSVVEALRTFIRLDESGMKPINLQASIETVLTLLQHRFNDRPATAMITIHKHYGELPLVTCYGDQMNQAIFNLVCNAIDAIDEKLANHDGAIADQMPQLTIHTQLIDEMQIGIQIRDNGIGIPDIHREQIFEPFFTTKSAGQGVGLGLATSRRIVEEVHGGQLSYESVMGEGTQFFIHLPIFNQP